MEKTNIDPNAKDLDEKNEPVDLQSNKEGVPKTMKVITFKGLRPTKGSKLKQPKETNQPIDKNQQKKSRPIKNSRKDLILQTPGQEQKHEETKDGNSPDMSPQGSPTRRKNKELLYKLQDNKECLGKFFLYKDNKFVWNSEAKRPNNQSTPKAQREIAIAIQGLEDLSEKELEFCREVLLKGAAYPLKINEINMCHIISVNSLENVLISFANYFLSLDSENKMKEILDAANKFFDLIFLDEKVREEAKDIIPLDKLNKIIIQSEEIRDSISACLVWIAKSRNIVERLKALDTIYSVFESAPTNLRPGDAASNSSIQEDLDPYLYEKQNSQEIVERDHSIKIRESFNNWRATLGMATLELIIKDDEVVSSSRPLLGKRKEMLKTEVTEHK